MTSPSASRKTVLVASDTPFVRERFKTALDAAGHRAVVVKSVAELLGRVRADLAELDLIVLDLRMPHATGVDLVRSVRKLDSGHLPILVFSGSVSSAEEVGELAALGVGGYLNEYSAVEHILPSIKPHLFPDDFNRRDGPRVVMGIPVSYSSSGKIAAALSLNLSHGGLAIRTTAPLPRESTLRLRFHLPGSKKELGAEAVVCWSSEKAGMGLRFTSVKPADQKLIDVFVDAHFFRSVKT
ncbi:MAG: PilZ domain-containing protein [Vicinamibacterales bacterium]